MNKQEVIQKISDSKFCSKTIPLTFQSECFNQGVDAALKIISKLDEPQIIKVPAFVAEWFEENEHNLNFAIFELCEAGKAPVDLSEGLTDFEKWFYLNQDIETLVRMVDGYEVEEELKYYVQLPFLEWNEEAAELDQTELYLGFDITSDETRFMTNKNGYRDFKTELDEETIKSIDERYWSFAVPVEKV